MCGRPYCSERAAAPLRQATSLHGQHHSAPQICFVGDEAFRQLSRVDEDAPTALSQAMARDGSREWLGNRKQKQEARLAAGGAGALMAAKPAAHTAHVKGSAAAKLASPAAAPAAASK